MKKSIKQSKLIFLVNLATMVLLVVILASLGVTARQSRIADNMNETRFGLSENATLFMNASAYLTSEVRAYAATGDKSHSDNYTKELEQVKTREACIEAMKAIGITSDEQAKIDEMMSISNQLLPLEKQAIASGRCRKFKRGRYNSSGSLLQ